MAKSFYHLQKKKEFASEELKKIKTELKEESDFTGAGHLVVEWETIEKIIDNRISELKGEQNIDR